MTGAVCVLAAGGRGPVTLTGSWSGIGATFPTTTTTATGDPTLTFAGGARTISCIGNSTGTLEHRIDSGAWTTHGAGVAVTSGQTIGWRVTGCTANDSQTMTVRDASRGDATIGTFSFSATGFP